MEDAVYITELNGRWEDLVHISNEFLYLVMGGMTVSIPNELLNIFSSIIWELQEYDKVQQ